MKARSLVVLCLAISLILNPLSLLLFAPQKAEALSAVQPELLPFSVGQGFSIFGDKKKAKDYFFWVVDKVEDYIPEQIFENNVQVSVSPLAWSHVMFLISGKFLKLF